jgi:hypothetical protein
MSIRAAPLCQSGDCTAKKVCSLLQYVGRRLTDNGWSGLALPAEFGSLGEHPVVPPLVVVVNTECRDVVIAGGRRAAVCRC